MQTQSVVKFNTVFVRERVFITERIIKFRQKRTH